MDNKSNNPTGRFSDRVENYVKYRPGYPPEILNSLADFNGLTAETVIADIGAGTGLSADMFLRNGNKVFAVEPNYEMRSAAEKILMGVTNFVSTDGAAESTSLVNESIDLIVAGQAFHWFTVEATKT